MSRNVNLWLLLFLVLVLVSFWKLYPTVRYHTSTPETRQAIEDRDADAFKGIIKLGLDLQGGIRMVLQIDRSKLTADEAKDAANRALEVIRNRVDQYGVSEPVIQKQGEERIVVELPGFSDIERAKKLVGSTAQLEFKLVREAEHVGPALDAIDRYMKRKSGLLDSAAGGSVDSSEESLQPKAAEAVADSAKADSIKSLFGVSARDTADTSKTAEEKEAASQEEALRKDKPFTSLLVKAQYDIAVPKKNFDKVKRILAAAGTEGALMPGVEFAWSAEPEGEPGSEYRRLYLLKSKAELTGSYLKDANPSVDQSGMSGGSVVNMSLNGEGARRFSKITAANIEKRLAIVLDGQVYSAPVIRSKIPNGNAEISGMADYEEARDLSIVLRAGALPAPMDIIEERTVGPSLGRDSIIRSIYAFIIGALLVTLYVFFIYRLTGFIVMTALALNILFVLAILAGMGLTLTLPGIAGIILTMGMAVDGNVLINERIKEELRTGKTIRASIEAGYARAFSAIFDSNLTTLITAVILDYYGTGPIKGFAVNLIIGLLCSMFTGIWVTRQIFNKITATWNIQKLSI